MMKKANLALILLCIILSPATAVSREDLGFLLDRNLTSILDTHLDDMTALLDAHGCPAEDIRLVLEYAARHGHPALARRCRYMLAKRMKSLDEAVSCLRIPAPTATDSTVTRIMLAELRVDFPSRLDSICLSHAIGDTDEQSLVDALPGFSRYNSVIEDIARQRMDEIAVERSDSLALAMISGFLDQFPHSQWAHTAEYYRYYHLEHQGRYGLLDSLLCSPGNTDIGSTYARMVFLSRHRDGEDEGAASLLRLDRAAAILADLEARDIDHDIGILYDIYTPAQWKQLLCTARLEIAFNRYLITNGEEAITAFDQEAWNNIWAMADSIQTMSNDRGELAKLHYMKARILAFNPDTAIKEHAAREYLACLVAGAPRNPYDAKAAANLTSLGEALGISETQETWQRSLANYRGITFTDITPQSGLADKRFTRIAIGDYDNDGWPDLLFNGTYLYKNNGDLSFTDVSETAINTDLQGSGGLWADFNKDGRLDFVSVSHAENGIGEALMKNQENRYFVNVNERAGEIEDFSPTEGAAWIDIDGEGYPSLYCANYEKWQVQSGYPDHFWYNSGGYFFDGSRERGFWNPPDAADPGLAGRGVAPADYDNDGQQEILVTNYRLCRNFAFDQQTDGSFADHAFLDGLAGDYSQGYYGHSIGADWGDYDNDGDLDVFIANLAHPRYIDFSDISMLLRNDGPAAYIFEGQLIPFHSFTDVTREAGITWDELHSDPLWFDADSDGWLDLFITSVYENDRSYLYHNNGDGTFTDITWLSGTRVYNGWGNASGDLNRDGRPDLVVGSGNGVKILLNTTENANSSVWVKPVWKNGEVVLARGVDEFIQSPDSPAYGTRVRVTLQDPDGHISILERELSSAKGTTSQNDQALHFGIGKSRIISIERVQYEKDQK